uniref:Uncharacterized protein n=1 Tax=Arion vulgaris TaxID=1028688 RepID=A0A0B7B1Q8_9EUPU
MIKNECEPWIITQTLKNKIETRCCRKVFRTSWTETRKNKDIFQDLYIEKH